MVEAETAATSGSALVATPPSAWTGESLWSGDLLELSASARATWAVPASDQTGPRAAGRREVATVVLAGGDAVVRSYDSAGRLQREVTASGTEISVQVTAGGFTIVTPAP